MTMWIDAMRRTVSPLSYKNAIAALVQARHLSGRLQRLVDAVVGKPSSATSSSGA